MARGKFITVEGGEGAGKSTHADLLAASLKAAGIDVLVTREPGGTEGAEAIRRLLIEGGVLNWQPVTEALLHYAARSEHVAKTIRPALESGRWVISDRFADSTVAYQGHGQGLDRKGLTRLHALALGSFAPDLTFVLDLPVKAGIDRAFRRSGQKDRYERMDAEFHARVRKGFQAIARRNPRRCVLIDASPEVAEVQRAMRAALSKRLRVRLE